MNELGQDNTPMMMLLAMLVIVGMIGLLTIVQHFMPERPNYDPCIEGGYSETPIKSLNLGKEIHGSFFIGMGSINQVPQYYYYVQTGVENGYRLISRSAEFVEIREDNNQTPTQIDFKKFGCLDILIVPVGTVVQEYKADVGDL